MKKIMDEKQYEEYVKQKTPVSNLWKNMAKAFLVGGEICVLGQVIMNYCKGQGLDKETAGSWTSLILVLFSVILTGFNVYGKLAQWGGAGALVPITGFANSMSSSALDSKSEGLVFGIGANMFKLGGTVITYGIVSASLLGVIRYVFTLFG